jgi:hypothetical protein
MENQSPGDDQGEAVEPLRTGARDATDSIATRRDQRVSKGIVR